MKLISKALIIDLDAHQVNCFPLLRCRSREMIQIVGASVQGNGHENDFLGDDKVYILDMYNGSIYPHDERAKRAIKRKVELRSYMGDEEYLEKVHT